MSEKIYIIGHKSPDLDSVAAAISYARYLNNIDSENEYIPAVAGEMNRETAYALGRFGFSAPEKVGSAAGKNMILVDHNEFLQAADGMAEAKIIEVLDHHKIDFKYSEPIRFVAYPWGSSNTIIAKLFADERIVPDKNLAGLMLSAILVDTVITKSPTTTEMDRRVIEQLAPVAGIADWRGFGMELFKVRASVSELSAREIIHSDFKDFEFKSGKFGIGQVETVDLKDFASREAELMEELSKVKSEGGYHSVVLFITDIINEGSKFFIATDDAKKIANALGKHLEDGKAYLEGVISRKKQVLPIFMEEFDK
jgi:manganese-dependent inorganic pyrophosphatase